jgi:hypothetical protein
VQNVKLSIVDSADQPKKKFVQKPRPPSNSNQISSIGQYGKSKRSIRGSGGPRTQAIAADSSRQSLDYQRQSPRRRRQHDQPNAPKSRYGKQLPAPPRRTFQLLSSSNGNEKTSKDHPQDNQQVHGGDDWYVDLSRRAPTFYQDRSILNEEDVRPETSTTNNVTQSMKNAEKTLGSLRRSIIMGKDYPPIINKYSRTRAAAIVDNAIRHPVPARIGGLFSSFVGTLHLDYKKSINRLNY